MYGKVKSNRMHHTLRLAERLSLKHHGPITQQIRGLNRESLVIIVTQYLVQP